MAKKEFPSDKLDQYIVRFPDGMRDRIKEAAAVNNRSMNAEIIHRLEHSFDSSRAFEPNKTLAERLALADELSNLARGLMLQEIEIAKAQGREIDLDAAKKLSDEAVKRARQAEEPTRPEDLNASNDD